MKPLLSRLGGPPDRLGALRRFAVTITVVTVLGHIFFGFETSYATTVAGALSACCVQLALEWIRAKVEGVAPGYCKGQFFNFLLSPYIVGMSCAMFLFTNGRLWPMIFACTLAIGSKYIFRIKKGEGSIHFLNPSNLGILVTLVAFPAVTVFLPYSFSSGLGDVGDVIFPAVLFIAGCSLNGFYTKRLILIFAWFGAVILQAFARYLLFDAQLLTMLAVATGPVAIIFSFYMISDPATTPEKPWAQIAFGAAIGVFYGVLTAAHVVYSLFWALFLTCACRGLYIFLSEKYAQLIGVSTEEEVEANRLLAEQ